MAQKSQEIKNLISEVESQTLIQELIRISLHCIAFLRNIFDDNNFEDTYFTPNPIIRNTEKYVKIKKLVKGVSKEGDLFQSWIEKGINDAIRMKYLRAIQFSIYLDEQRPQDLTECYLFEINYAENDISISVNNKYEYDFTNLGNREKVQQLIKRLIVLTQSFNPLPAKKFVSIRLLFHDYCPKDYQPLFFKDASNLETTTIEVEKRNRGVIDEIGSIETGHDSVNIRILTNYGKSIKNPIKLDPFDLVYGEISFTHYNATTKLTNESNEKKLSLDKFLDSRNKTGYSTQVVPSSLQFTDQNIAASSRECECGAGNFPLISYVYCDTCFRKVHACCYGITPGTQLAKCYTCTTKKLEFATNALMRIRFLWKYFTFYGIPNFLQLFRIFNLNETTNKEDLKVILNRLFKDKIIINSGKPVLKKNGDFVFGCGYIYPLFDGIIDNTGRELIAHEQYSIAFVPRVKAYFRGLDYSNLVKQVYFPKRIRNEEAVTEILHKFRQIISDDKVIEKPESTKCIGYESKNSDIRNPMQNLSIVDMNSKMDDLDSLSFEDSLSFLSQSQRKSHDNSTDISEPDLKKRKVSVNRDRLY